MNTLQSILLFIIPDSDKFVGIPIEKPFLQNDWLTIIIFFAFFITALFVSAKRNSKNNNNIFSTNYFRDDEKRQGTRTGVENLGRIILTLCGALGYTLIWESTTNNNPSALSITAVYFVILAFIYCKFLLLRFYISTYIEKTPTNALETYETIIGSLGTLMIGGFLATQYAPSFFIVPSFIILAIIAVIACLIILYLLYTTFFNQAGLFIEFILYLCALEIGPIAVLLKMLYRLSELIN